MADFRHEANRRRWDADSASWARGADARGIWKECHLDPSVALHSAELKWLADAAGKSVAVLGSGNNQVVFALAGLGAKVTSVDGARNRPVHSCSASAGAARAPRNEASGRPVAANTSSPRNMRWRSAVVTRAAVSGSRAISEQQIEVAPRRADALARGSAQVLEKAQFGQVPRKTKPFSWIVFARALPDLAEFGFGLDRAWPNFKMHNMESVDAKGRRELNS
jgi:cation diffusion facilitator CzcD-associated flavoprotein CzcO